jgi:ankyrin repeat protein
LFVNRFDGAIVQAVKNRSATTLRLLLQVPDSFPVEDARRGLQLAVSSGDAVSVELLLGAGVSANSVDSEGVPLLYRAIAGGHIDIVRQLIDAGCCVSRRIRNSSALHCCIANGQDRCLVAIVEAGADVNMIDDDGNTPLVLAAKNCRRSTAAMKFLVEAGCDLECRDKDQRTALHYASYRAVGVEMLLSAGANPDSQVCILCLF